MMFMKKDFPTRGESDDENENYECNDIKDLEFRLAHDLNKLQVGRYTHTHNLIYLKIIT